MKKIITTLGCIVALCLHAQTVTTDNTFGTNGISVLSHQTNGNSVINSIVQTDGKIVVTGMRINGANNEEVFIARFNANGTLDTTFANSGYFTSYQDPNAYSANLYLNGNKILIFYPEQGVLIKFNNDGSVDNSFGTNGMVTLASTSYQTKDVLIGNYLYAVKNVSSQVILDKIDINSGSVISSSTISGLTQSRGVYSGPNGKLIVKSTDYQSLTTSLTLVDTNGNLDMAFGTNGSIIVSSFGSLGEIEASYDYVSTDDAQNIIYALSNDNAFTVTFKKYSSNGSLATGFANNGSYVLANAIISGLKTLSNQIYFSGLSLEGGTANLLLGRLNSNGTLDSSFDNDGIYIYDTNASSEWAESFNILSPSSIIVAGEISGTNNNIYVGKFDVTPDLEVSEVDSKESILFENPLRSNFVYKAKEKISVIELYSAEGKLIKMIKENNQNITELLKGVYVAKVKFENGNTVTKKLIKN
ncbi:T9SS type A sorting domain-containing protein [Epilithonimonas caeni]|uniref:T9SS type A sorting domain-containing protein n=1 Tax=Epilithonimonas caeni TaxID=365343 RepID=UPI0004195EC4|nr:T9SS type A sorting domain-containing protein [Epilithonimonas caeni]